MAGYYPTTPGAALGEGLNTGADFAEKVIGAARKKQQYQQEQAGRQAQSAQIDSVANHTPGAPEITGGTNDTDHNAAAHSDFLQSLGQGLSHIGTGITNFFAGAPAAAAPGAKPGAAPASALPAAPSPLGLQPGQRVELPGDTVVAPGGSPPVGLPQAPGAPTAGTAGGAPAFMADGGPVPGANEPRAYLDQGGPVPTPGAALGAGLNQGAQFGQTVANNARQTQQYNQDQAARQAETHPIEQFAEHLNGANHDNGPPGGANVGLPAAQAAAQKGANPAQAQAVGLTAQVAQDPDAQQGKPETAPHSLTPDWWDENDRLMIKAASAAAAAGHDPDTVFQSLNHMRTSYVQGHMLRAASAASVALQNGDMAAVEQNLKNMNYYLPDGKDLTVQKDSDGNLVYQNPLDQFLDSNGQPTPMAKDPNGKPNRPNMIPVDQAHIQMLGQAIIDPMKVNDILMATRSAVAKQRLEAAQTQAALNNSEGRRDLGKARLAEVAGINYKNLAAGDLDRAKAATAGYSLARWRATIANQKLDPSLLKGASTASSAIDDVLLGTKKSISTTDENALLGGTAGKVVHDPDTVPKDLRNLNPLEAGELKAQAGDLYLANAHTGMSPQQAAQVALQIRSGSKQSHPGPGGQKYPNAYVHRQNGEVGVWNPQTKKYDRYRIGAQSAAGLLDQGGQMPESALIQAGLGGGAGGGGGAQGEPSDNEQDFVASEDNGQQPSG